MGERLSYFLITLLEEKPNSDLHPEEINASRQSARVKIQVTINISQFR